MPTQQEVIEAFNSTDGNIQKTARLLGVSRTSIYHHLQTAGIKKPRTVGRITERKVSKKPKPKKGKVKRYLLTSAQNNTKVHGNFFDNLLAYANHIDAELIVGTFTYDLSSYGPKEVKRGKAKHRAELDWAPEVKPFICDDRVELAPGLQWCGEMNTLPTAVRPLSGLQTYTQRASGIFPHAKLAAESVASAKGEPTKFNYTTGTVTQRNYIQKKAGIKAEFHHVYGALIVEVDDQQNWWVRQIVADKSGKFYDLDLLVDKGEVTNHEGVEAITWGDIHSSSLDKTVKEVCWGKGGMLDVLQPRYQFFHDLLSGHRINHHEWKNPHEQFRLHVDGWANFSRELSHAAEFLRGADRPWIRSIVVYSNHDEPWILRWLKECDYRKDPENAELFLELQLEKYRSIRKGVRTNLLEVGVRSMGAPMGVRFLGEDEPFAVCRGQIECGMHGHLGPNGSGGTPLGLSRMGRRANTAHTHSAGILDGLYVAGTSTRLDMRFNRGPSSWSHTHIVTYPNGKRTLVTLWNGRYRA